MSSLLNLLMITEMIKQCGTQCCDDVSRYKVGHELISDETPRFMQFSYFIFKKLFTVY